MCVAERAWLIWHQRKRSWLEVQQWGMVGRLQLRQVAGMRVLYEEYTAKSDGVTGARVASCDIIGSAVLCEEINTATREYVWDVAAL